MGQKRRKQTILANWQRYRWPWGPIWGGEPVQAFSQTSVPLWMLVQLLIYVLWCTVCVHRLCIYIISYLSMCGANRLCFFSSFFGSKICTSMGQNWPPVWVACLREKCQAPGIANVSRSAVKHSPPTWCSTETGRERDPVGSLRWSKKKDLWLMICRSVAVSMSAVFLVRQICRRVKTTTQNCLRLPWQTPIKINFMWGLLWESLPFFLHLALRMQSMDQGQAALLERQLWVLWQLVLALVEPARTVRSPIMITSDAVI